MVSKKNFFSLSFFPVTHREQQSKSISKSGRIKSNIEQKFAFRETRAKSARGTPQCRWNTCWQLSQLCTNYIQHHHQRGFHHSSSKRYTLKMVLWPLKFCSSSTIVESSCWELLTSSLKWPWSEGPPHGTLSSEYFHFYHTDKKRFWVTWKAVPWEPY